MTALTALSFLPLLLLGTALLLGLLIDAYMGSERRRRQERPTQKPEGVVPCYHPDFLLYLAIMRREQPGITDRQVMVRYLHEDFLGDDDEEEIHPACRCDVDDPKEEENT